MTQHLKKSRGDLRALFDDGVDAMFVLSDGERITDVNKSACDLLGQERDALIGTNLSKLIGHSKTTGLDRYTVTEARHTAVEAIRRTWVLETGKKYPTFDVPLTSKESEDVLCELDLKRIPHGIYAVFRDITERKRLEEAIVSEKQRLDDIVSEIGAGLSMVDKNMKVVWMNKVQSSWFGELKDVKGHECFNVYWDANEVCKDCPSKKTFTSGTVEKAFKLYTTSDGKQRWYSITSSPLKDRTGEVTHVLELLEDVTKEKLAEEEFKRLHESVVQANIKLEQSLKNLKSTQQQLIQAEKLASMGQLAASVAHEINNPLSYIDNNLEILNRYSGRMKKFLTKCDAGRHIFEKGDIDEIMCFFQEVQDLKKETKLSVIFEDFGEVIKESRCGTDQIKKIVSSLGTFSRVEEDLPTSANINEVIESILAMVWGELKHKATVIKEYGDIPKIECYPQQLGQVFMNLLTNAAHAIESTGEIRIKTYKADDTVCVEIKDTGKGIPGNLQPRIFEPFFTTKEPGKGTGLGLTVVYNIIQRHLGSVIVSSKVGEGTTFKVCFPIRE
jgi:PAS domain S-box-containing protein